MSRFLIIIGVICVIASGFAKEIAYRDPTDFSGWEKCRGEAQHPCGLYNQADIDRVRRRIETDDTARAIVLRHLGRADEYLDMLTPEYLEEWVPAQRGFGTYGPCPACRDKGLRWHPNGTWDWNPQKPDQVICKTCKTIFPNEKYPETIHLRSKWNPDLEVSYVGGEPFKMYGTLCRLSVSGMLRIRRLHHTVRVVDHLAYAYIFSGDAKYADGVRRILLRYTEVIPRYPFAAGIYNEIADCDPHIAGRDPYRLPTDELTTPPNLPDRKIHKGYWMGNRFGSSGQDGHFAISLALCYDVTCTAKWPDGRPVFSTDECIRIERDLLLEVSWHLMCDQSINNKSVGGRAACAVVGTVVGHPDLTRFGLDGFYKTVYGWFLPDFTTSESSGYLTMTLNNILPFSQWFRDYSDPACYEPPEGGEKLRHFNVFRDTDYGICLENAINTLQGNLTYPPIADSRAPEERFSTGVCNLLPICHPTPRNLSFFWNLNKKLTNSRMELIFGPLEQDEGLPELVFEDNVYSHLQQGYLRYGPLGRDALAVLNASDQGIHHHADSLGLYLWHKKELLSDLGYLWDHPDKHYTVRTAAHNLVLVDNKGQRTRGRHGSFDLFETAGPVKAMRASSEAYSDTSIYQRTLLQVDHGEAGFYWLDLFRVQGGRQRDYLFHGLDREFTIEGTGPLGDADLSKPGRTSRFCLMFKVDRLGTWEFSDVEMYKVDKNGKRISENMAMEFPAKKPEEKTCPGWGMYVGNGKASWEPCQGRTGRGVRYAAMATNPDTTVVNHGICIGECNGFVGPNAFLGKPGERYAYRFYARGDEAILSPYMLQFYPGDENSQDGRNYDTIQINEARVGAEWKLYEGTAVIQELKSTNTIPSTPVALRRDDGRGAWNVRWDVGEGQSFAVFSPYSDGEEFYYALDWGQRHHDNRDRGKKLPYFFRRRRGKQLDSFVTIFHSYFGEKPLVKDVSVMERPEGVVATVKTALGEDTFLFAAEGTSLGAGRLSSDAEIAVALDNGQGRGALAMFKGRHFQAGEFQLTCETPAYQGRVARFVNKKQEAYFVLEGNIPPHADWAGHTLIARGQDGIDRPYQIRKSAWQNGEFLVYTRVDGYGLPVHAAETWLMPNRACVEF